MAEEIADLAKSFARALRAEGKAPRTVELYGMSVRLFREWLADQGTPATLDALTRANLRDWLADLTAEKSSSTVRTRYRGMFRFCGWLAAEEEIPKNPMAGMQPPAAKVKPVPVLSDAELAALTAVCKGKDFNQRRDMAMIRLLLDCGVRVSELCALTADDLDLDAEQAIVTGKGNKVRAVYFASRTTAALDAYLRSRRAHRWAHLPQLLLTQRGALSVDGARERVRLLGEAAGIEGLHPHRFRHTFAHDYLMAGGQERDLKRLAGWSSDVMLERYGASAADVRARAAAKRLQRGNRV